MGPYGWRESLRWDVYNGGPIIPMFWLLRRSAELLTSDIPIVPGKQAYPNEAHVVEVECGTVARVGRSEGEMGVILVCFILLTWSSLASALDFQGLRWTSRLRSEKKDRYRYQQQHQNYKVQFKMQRHDRTKICLEFIWNLECNSSDTFAFAFPTKSLWRQFWQFWQFWLYRKY